MHDLTELKAELVSAIDQHPDRNVAGVWKAGREAYAAPERVIDAAKLGTRFFDPRVRLEELQARMADASDAEAKGFMSGLRDAVDHMLRGSVRGDANLRARVSSPEAQEKIAWAVGPDRADWFNRAIESEANFAKAPQSIVGGSPTQPRTEAVKNWTPQPSELAEEVHKLIKPEHAMPVMAAEMVGHALGLPTVASAAIGAGGAFLARQSAKAAAAAAEKVRNEVAPIFTLKGADRAGAINELLGRSAPPAPAAPAPRSLGAAATPLPPLHAGAWQAGDGPHGPVIEGYQGRWPEAVDWLRRAQTGDLKGVLAHPQVPGRIDVVWGEHDRGTLEGHGLKHIIEQDRPEMVADLPNRLAAMKKVKETPNRIQLSDGNSTAIVSRDWAGQPKTWLLTAFEGPARRR